MVVAKRLTTAAVQHEFNRGAFYNLYIRCYVSTQ
jgi:hypothetical protein